MKTSEFGSDKVVGLDVWQMLKEKVSWVLRIESNLHDAFLSCFCSLLWSYGINIGNQFPFCFLVANILWAV